MRVPLPDNDRPGYSGVGTDMDIASVAGGSLVTLAFVIALLAGVLVGKCIKFGLGEGNDD